MAFAEAVVGAEARLFTKRTTLLAATVWFSFCAVGLVRQYLDWHWPYMPTAFSTGCVDFGWTWISGKFAALREPARVFDYASFAKAQADLFGAGNCTVLFAFPYPPTMLFFTYPFGLLPFATAYVLWTAVLTAFLLGTVYAVTRSGLAAVSAVAMKPAITNIYLGQNAFLTAGLLGSALAVLERRPVLAGFLFALLTYKPQYGLLIPVALTASRSWRALASAAGFSLVMAVAAALAFGGDSWSAFLSHLTQSNESLSERSGFPVFHYSVYGMFEAMGFGTAAGMAGQGIVLLLLGAAVWRVWSRPFPYDLQAALLCIASLVASPYVLYYQVAQLVLAFVFLISDGLRRGFLVGERLVMALAWFALVFASQSVVLVVCGALLWLLHRRLRALRRPDAQPADLQIVSGEKPILDIA